MVDLIELTDTPKLGGIFSETSRTVVVYDGTRGPAGLPGEQGDTGAPGGDGDSLVVKGMWSSGNVYGPLDSVQSRSTAVDNVSSLFTQISSFPTGVSTVEPHLDPTRWTEVGATDTDGVFGGVWTVHQTAHPFSKIGQPAALQGSGYSLASAASASLLGIAIVREVIDLDSFVLQSTGGLKEFDPSVISGGNPVAGETYYVSATAGFLTLTPPTGTGQVTNPIFVSGPTVDVGVVVPWTPVENTAIVVGVPSARSKFYYTMSAGQTLINVADDQGNTPVWIDTKDVFRNGLNLRETDEYTFDATSVTLAASSQAGDRVEIWTENAAISVVIQRVKIDPLVFDGSTTTFSIKVAGTGVAFTTPESLDVLIDGNPQEPGVDYTTLDNAGDTDIVFNTAPETEDRFWGLLTEA